MQYSNAHILWSWISFSSLSFKAHAPNKLNFEEKARRVPLKFKKLSLLNSTFNVRVDTDSSNDTDIWYFISQRIFWRQWLNIIQTYTIWFFPLLVLLILASQRIETVFAEWLDSDFLEQYFSEDVTTKRGSMPSLVEWAILAWVAGKTPLISYSIYHCIKLYFNVISVFLAEFSFLVL